MNQHLKNIQDLLQQNRNFSDADKEALLKSIVDADKQWTITDFKLDRTEKVKKTTAILLEETIEELEQKRKAVEAQNRELEIESSLEKVRTVAMGMRKRDDMLDICQMMSKQLESLGIKEIRNVQTAIFYKDKGIYANYEYYRLHDKALVTEVDYTKDKISTEFAAHMMKGPDEFFSRSLAGKEVQDWYHFQKTTNVFIDAYLEKAGSLTYYWFSLGSVALGMSSYVPLSEKELNLFKRFRNVFGLAYRRYIDIEKAEAQAREAQIELGLERVRARAMAMQKSDELKELIGTVFIELTKLDLALTRCLIMIYDARSNDSTWWMANSEAPADPIGLYVKYHQLPPYAAYISGWKDRKIKWQYTLEGKDKKDWDDFLFGKTELSQLPDFVIAGMKAPDRVYLSASFNNFGCLNLATLEPLSGEHFDILLRFAKVFDLTYTRFNDLQKAEAQAREAKIEASLERVRSRTMAMHQTSELQEVIHTVHNELLNLNLSIDGGSFVVINDEVGPELHCWGSGGTANTSEEVHVPHFNMPFCTNLIKGIKSGLEFFTEEFSQTEKKEYFTKLFEHKPWSDLSDVRKKETLSSMGGYTRSVAVSRHTTIFVINHHGRKFTEAENDILKRFAKVFEQTYTRFLDLQKAEAQAREAQIQLALERVRARSLAMHHTSELQEVVNIVAQQLHNMNIDINGGVFIAINDEVDNDIPLWASGGAADYVQKVTVPFLNSPVLITLRDAIRRKNNFFTEEHSYEEKIGLFEHLFKYPPWNSLSQQRKQELLSREGGYTRSVAVSNHTSIAITNHKGKTFSDEDNEILERFGNVFEQSYTRFLDLQKAEAQVREAQIEAALERVRSRTMGMQKSNELKEVIQVVYDQFVHLNIHIEHTGFIIDYKARDDMHIWLADQHLVPSEVTIPCFDSPPNNSIKEAKEKGQDFFTYHLTFEEKNKFYRDLFKFIPGVPEESLEYYLNCPGLAGSGVLLENIGLYIENFSGNPYSDDVNATLMRFGKVFQQTYTRFLDLQKAEAQAKESLIELGLERVRARAMAMQKSDELRELIGTVFIELTKLDLALTRCLIMIYDARSNDSTWWMANSEAPADPIGLYVKYHQLPPYAAYISGWKDRKIKWQYTLEGKDKKDWDDFLFGKTELSQLPDFVIAGMKAPDRVYLSASFNNFGCLNLATLEPLSGEHFDILLRFAKVFDLTYTRFNDLQKAEAQAREAKIEAALERTRTQSMIMQHSKELDDTLRVFHEQVLLLGIHSAFSFLWLPDEEKDRHIFWAAWGEDKNGSRVFKSKAINYPLDRNEPATTQCLVDWKSDEPIVSYHVPPSGVENYFAAWQELIDGVEHLKPVYFSGGLYYVEAFMKYGCFGVMVESDLLEDEKKVLGRFAVEFERTYTRFLDLQKAEAQAREAKIEAALERVRSRSMAMQKSEELKEVIQVVYDQFIHLNIHIEHTGFIIDYKQRDDMHIWLADKHAVPFQVTIPYFDCAHWNSFNEAKEKGIDFFANHLSFEEKNRFYQDLFKLVPGVPEETWEYYLNCPGLAISTVLLENVGLYVENFSGIPYTDEENATLMRFGKVFQQTYTRFLDLKNAEAQAWEATVEAALEKVRGQAMAMHNSNDLSSTASIIFTELRKLGISPIRCGVGLLTKESRKAQLYSATSSTDGDSLALIGWVELSAHPVLENIYDTWLKNEEYYPELSGEQLKSYYELLLKGLPVKVPDSLSGQKQYGTFLPFSVGCLYAWSAKPYNDAQIKILKRFATIIDLTFRRYIELQKSESNAREAVKQAALDRVRADIASMRTIADLDKITPLIWNELTILGIPFIRCGVFIMDDSRQLIHTFLSTPDGKAIAAFHLPYNITANITQVLSHWRDKKNYIDHWDESAFAEFANILVKQGELASAEQYLKTIPQGGFYLHFLPFLQGMLYVGNSTQLNEEQIKLIQSVADAFSTAYARYEDFNKLEAAKQQVEKTLVDLKQAQTQLVQSEKMASLGELTAGIAHEIQNPLNFVNNFSEVSTELLEEMKDELEKGNYEEAIDIANDVVQNLEKINHHGKRADGIVKGMLQHSRSSSGLKEPTDINALADEYLRLCYHGLRAKDKSFNASIKTDFDKTIGMINIIPQDIGRVILNLLTNAFYAASLPSPENIGTGAGGFSDSATSKTPAVSLGTKKEGTKVLITVRDNGPGISQKVLDKIFQPFFTTKPTGKGTGLGLSLSYDIVKAHGGELKVETREGEGCEFVIQLPVV